MSPSGSNGSDFGTLGEFEGIFDIDAEIADGALDLCVAEKDLHRAEVTRRFVDDRRLRASKRVGSVLLRVQANAGNPFVHQPGILARAHMPHIVVPAGEDVVRERPASAL